MIKHLLLYALLQKVVFSEATERDDGKNAVKSLLRKCPADAISASLFLRTPLKNNSWFLIKKLELLKDEKETVGSVMGKKSKNVVFGFFFSFLLFVLKKFSWIPQPFKKNLAR